MTDGSAADEEPAAFAELTGYELWDRTQQAHQQVAEAYDHLFGAASAGARVAAAPEFLGWVRQLLALRLVAVAEERRRAFPRSVPPARSRAVAALWAEVFWAARAESSDDDCGSLAAADASIRGLLTLHPADLGDRDAVRGWWERLRLVEETLDGLAMAAQAAAEGRQAVVDQGPQVGRGNG